MLDFKFPITETIVRHRLREDEFDNSLYTALVWSASEPYINKER